MTGPYYRQKRQGQITTIELYLSQELIYTLEALQMNTPEHLVLQHRHCTAGSSSALGIVGLGSPSSKHHDKQKTFENH